MDAAAPFMLGTAPSTTPANNSQHLSSQPACRQTSASASPTSPSTSPPTKKSRTEEVQVLEQPQAVEPATLPIGSPAVQTVQATQTCPAPSGDVLEAATSQPQLAQRPSASSSATITCPTAAGAGVPAGPLHKQPTDEEPAALLHVIQVVTNQLVLAHHHQWLPSLLQQVHAAACALPDAPQPPHMWTQDVGQDVEYCACLAACSSADPALKTCALQLCGFMGVTSGQPELLERAYVHQALIVGLTAADQPYLQLAAICLAALCPDSSMRTLAAALACASRQVCADQGWMNSQAAATSLGLLQLPGAQLNATAREVMNSAGLLAVMPGGEPAEGSTPPPPAPCHVDNPQQHPRGVAQQRPASPGTTPPSPGEQLYAADAGQQLVVGSAGRAPGTGSPASAVRGAGQAPQPSSSSSPNGAGPDAQQQQLLHHTEPHAAIEQHATTSQQVEGLSSAAGAGGGGGHLSSSAGRVVTAGDGVSRPDSTYLTAHPLVGPGDVYHVMHPGVSPHMTVGQQQQMIVQGQHVMMQQLMQQQPLMQQPTVIMMPTTSHASGDTGWAGMMLPGWGQQQMHAPSLWQLPAYLPHQEVQAQGGLLTYPQLMQPAPSMRLVGQAPVMHLMQPHMLLSSGGAHEEAGQQAAVEHVQHVVSSAGDVRQQQRSQGGVSAGGAEQGQSPAWHPTPHAFVSPAVYPLKSTDGREPGAARRHRELPMHVPPVEPTLASAAAKEPHAPVAVRAVRPGLQMQVPPPCREVAERLRAVAAERAAERAAAGEMRPAGGDGAAGEARRFTTNSKDESAGGVYEGPGMEVDRARQPGDVTAAAGGGGGVMSSGGEAVGPGVHQPAQYVTVRMVAFQEGMVQQGAQLSLGGGCPVSLPDTMQAPQHWYGGSAGGAGGVLPPGFLVAPPATSWPAGRQEVMMAPFCMQACMSGAAPGAVVVQGPTECSDQ